MQGPNLPSLIPGPPDRLKPVGESFAAGSQRLGIARQGSAGIDLDAKSSTSRTLISQKPRPISSKLIISESISLESINLESSSLEPSIPRPITPEPLCPESFSPKPIGSKLINPESFNPGSSNPGSSNPESVDLESLDLESINLESINLQSLDLESVDLETVSLESISLESISLDPSGANAADAACLPVSPQDIAPVFAATKPPIDVEDVYRHCRNLGMRLSRQRRMVLDLLWVEKSHLSARDIFERLNNLGRNIGHTSVYQNLEALQSAGVIECLDRASGRLYGYRSDPHSHLTCSKTGRIQDLDVELPADLLRQIEAHTGYAIESYTMQFTGRPLASI
jgi:Fur family ferric uptake transcriptional regulator